MSRQSRYRAPLVAVMLDVCVALCGCAPQTDLLGTGAATAGAPTAAASAALVDPAPGTDAVPPNLASVMVRFPAVVAVPDGALMVVGAGRAAAVGSPEPADCPLGTVGACLRLPLSEPLAPVSTYVVSVGSGIVDDSGRAVDPGPVGQFATSAEADLVPPNISALRVEPTGPCVLVGFQTNESSAGTVSIRGGGQERSVSAGAGATVFSVPVSVSSFAGGTEIQVVARVVDLAGNAAEAPAVSLVVPADLLALAITEIYANAAGPEPAQEFVEIRNLGQQDIDLNGLSVEDSKAADKLPAQALPAGAYGLIVPSGFDPNSPVDVPPRAGTPLIRVDARLGSDGLSNTGEVVRVRTASGTVVSSYGGFVDVSASKWAGHSVHRVSENACDQPATWTRLPAPATPGWGPP